MESEVAVSAKVSGKGPRRKTAAAAGGTATAAPSGRGRAKNWLMVAAFQTAAEFDEWLKKDQVENDVRWFRKKERVTGEAVKRNYVCNRRGCTAGLRAQFYSGRLLNPMTVSVEKTNDHVHEENASGLSNTAVEAINNLYREGVRKPIQMFHILKSCGIKVSTKKQIEIHLRNSVDELDCPPISVMATAFTKLEEFCDIELSSAAKAQAAGRTGRGKAKTWTEFITLASQDDFQKWLEDNEAEFGGRWRKGKEHITAEGAKRYLRCSRHGCPADLRILYHSTCSAVTVYKGTDRHVHEGVTPNLSSTAKEAIRSFFQDGVSKPVQLYHILGSVGINVGAKKDIDAFLKNIISEENEPPMINSAIKTEPIEEESLQLTSDSNNKTVRGKAQDWTEVVTLATSADFENWLKLDETVYNRKWRKGKEHNTKDGVKRTLLCNKPNCLAELRVLYHSTSTEATVFKNAQQHLHATTKIVFQNSSGGAARKPLQKYIAAKTRLESSKHKLSKAKEVQRGILRKKRMMKRHAKKTNKDDNKEDVKGEIIAENSQDDEQQRSKVGRGGAKEWTELATMSTMEAFELWLKEDEKINNRKWRKGKRHETRDSVKRNYICSVHGCRAEIRVVFPNAPKSSITVYRDSTDHMHDGLHWGLSLTAKRIVSELVSRGITKPQKLFTTLMAHGIEVDSKKQIQNYMKRLMPENRRRVDGDPEGDAQQPTTTEPTPFDSSELIDWCESNSAVPIDDHDVFVLHHLVLDDSRQVQRMVLTTKALLRLAQNSDVVHVDTSLQQKLSWQGYSCVVIGVSDANREVHATVLAFFRPESNSASEFEIVLQTTKEGVEQHTGVAFVPRVVLVAAHDILKEISLAAEKVFPEAIRRISWSHMRKKVENRLMTTTQDVNVRRKCLQDVRNLQLALNEDQFDQAAAALLEKWAKLLEDLEGEGKDAKGLSEFISYFREKWLSTNSKSWFEGYDTFSPSSTAAMDSLCEVIRTNTFREKLPVAQFLDFCVQLVGEWSKDTAERRPFHHGQQVTQKQYEEAWAYMQEGKTPSVLSDGVTWFLPANGRQSLNEEELTKYLNTMEAPAVDSFDDYIQQRGAVWVVKTEGGLSTCSCPTGMKQGLCKHILAVGVWSGTIVIPEEVKLSPDSLPRRKRSLRGHADVRNEAVGKPKSRKREKSNVTKVKKGETKQEQLETAAEANLAPTETVAWLEM